MEPPFIALGLIGKANKLGSLGAESHGENSCGGNGPCLDSLRAESRGENVLFSGQDLFNQVISKALEMPSV